MPPFVSSPLGAFLLALSIGVGWFVRSNPVLFGLPLVGGEDAKESFDNSIYREHPVLDHVLQYHRDVLGDEYYEPYRNHCLRVLSFAAHSLRMRVEEDNTALDFVQFRRWIHLVAYAVAYHDLALFWTPDGGSGTGKGELDYLEPSVALMEAEWSAIHELKDEGVEKEENAAGE